MSTTTRALWRTRIQNRKVLLLDGGMGTMCERLGANIANTSLWSTQVLLEQPEIIAKIHAAYREAGADIVETCTYQLSEDGLAEWNKKNEKNNDESTTTTVMTIESVVQKAVQVASSVSSSSSSSSLNLIGGAVGPVGSSLPGGLEYTGNYPQAYLGDPREMTKFHTNRLAAMLTNDSNLDCLMLETMPRLDEVMLLLSMIESLRPSIPVIVSFMPSSSSSPAPLQVIAYTASCSESNNNSEHHHQYVSLQQAFKTVVEKFDQVVAVGVNCVSPSTADAAFAQFLASGVGAAAIGCSFVAYPNSGEVYQGDSGTWTGEENCSSTNEDGIASPWFARSIICASAAAASTSSSSCSVIIGGCCRTTPERDIAGLRRVIDSIR